MKFTGLILICATSCLALILPAIGVVHFPKSSESLSAASSIAASQGLPVSTQSGAGFSQTNLQWSQSIPPSSLQAISTSLMPPSSMPQPPMTSQAQLEAVGQFNGSVPQLDGTANSGGKLGMGVWFMLVPVCLLGLAMWTFAPNPSGAKSRSA